MTSIQIVSEIKENKRRQSRTLHFGHCRYHIFIGKALDLKYVSLLYADTFTLSHK